MQIVIVDPGIKSIGLLFDVQKEIYLIHCEGELDSLFDVAKCCFLKILNEKINFDELALFFFEKQIVFKNILTEGYIRGFIHAKFKKAKFKRLQPYAKNTFCKRNYNYIYKKARSKKILKTYPQEIIDEIKKYKIFVCDNTNITQISNDLINSKKLKLDDIADVALYKKIVEEQNKKKTDSKISKRKMEKIYVNNVNKVVKTIDKTENEVIDETIKREKNN
jgi:hypothetical protein